MIIILQYISKTFNENTDPDFGEKKKKKIHLKSGSSRIHFVQFWILALNPRSQMFSLPSSTSWRTEGTHDTGVASAPSPPPNPA